MMRKVGLVFLMWSAAVWSSAMLQDVARAMTTVLIYRTYPNFDYVSHGSGVLVDKENGLMITNAHVSSPSGLSKLFLKSARGDYLPLKIIAVDQIHDLAVVQVDPKKIQHMKARAVSKRLIYPGMVLYSVSSEASQGKVSIKGGSYVGDVFFANVPGIISSFGAALLHASGGSSGSPIINEYGEVQGIMYAGVTGMSYFVHAAHVDRLLQYARGRLKKNSKKLKAVMDYYFLPVIVAALPECIRNAPLLRGVPRALVLSRITPRVGARHSLKLGDVLLAVNGKKIGLDYIALEKAIDQHGTVSCQILRDGKEQIVELQGYDYDDCNVAILRYGNDLFISAPNQCGHMPSGEVALLTRSEGLLHVPYINGVRVSCLKDLNAIFQDLNWRPYTMAVHTRVPTNSRIAFRKDIVLDSRDKDARLYFIDENFQNQELLIESSK